MKAATTRRGRDPYRMVAMAVLAFSVLVIVSGDVVQATESGAGCGASWPRCDGSLIPRVGDAKTAIEFTHRSLTALLGLGFAALVLWTLRRRDRTRELSRSVAWATAFFGFEVVIGALLVHYGWVENDASLGRVVADAVHVVNTFLLVGALVLVVHHAGGGGRIRIDTGAGRDRLLIAGVAILLLVAISGAINSLADTLYFAEGVDVENTPIASILVAIRGIHPAVAIGGGLVLLFLVRAASQGAPEAGRIGLWIQLMVLGQFVIGVLNIALLTPLEIQVIHLASAHAIWISFVLLSASLLGAPVPRARQDLVVT